MSHPHHRKSLRQHLADLHGHGKNHSHGHTTANSMATATVPATGTVTTLTAPLTRRPRIARMHVRALGGCCSSSASPS